MEGFYIFILLFNACLLYESPFLEFYKENFTEQELVKKFLKEVGIEKDSCLPNIKDTIKILSEKYNIHVSEKEVTDNLRFIAGNCNPVILVPGIFSVKLMTQIDCKGLYKNETDNYRRLKFYCLSEICKDADEDERIEEYRLFLKLFGPFGFLKSITDANLYNACFSYFMTIFNEDECPFGNNTCTKSDYVKVIFFGGTNDTQKRCKCGTEASRDVFLTHEFMSNLIGTSKVYGDIIDLFLNSGYETGFSLGGIPNDFRKFVATNTFATEVFRYLIESFYNYTGKPVIIIAHSFGNLIALHNLVSASLKIYYLK